jgi:hypothetical protein
MALWFVFPCSLLHYGDRFFFRLSIEHLHGQGHHLGVIFGLAAFIIEFIGFQAALEKYQAAYMQILLADLAQPSPGFDVDPFGAFLGLPFARFPAVADCQAEVGNILPGGRKAAFGILAETAD